MGYMIGAFVISLFVQLIVCLTEKTAIVKLIPVLIESSVFLCLIVLSLELFGLGLDTDSRIMLAFYALVTLVGLAGIGLAWLLYAVKKRIYDF